MDFIFLAFWRMWLELMGISLKLEINFNNLALPGYWLCQYISTESISHILLCSSIYFLQYFNCIVILPSTLGLFLDFCCFELLWMGSSPLIPVPKHTCVHGVCMCMNMCVQLWKPEVDAKCPPLLFSTLSCWDMAFHCDPKLAVSVRLLAGETLGSIRLHTLSFEITGTLWHTAFLWVLESKSDSSAAIASPLLIGQPLEPQKHVILGYCILYTDSVSCHTDESVYSI